MSDWESLMHWTKCFPVTPPASLQMGNQSDGTMSSGCRSPVRQRRPHSVAGQLPGYASPTVASQIKTARSPEKNSAGNQMVCYRCSKLDFTFTLCCIY